MRKRLSVFVVIVALISFGSSRTNAQNRSTIADDRTREATIKAFLAYQDGMKKADRAYKRREITVVEEMEERISITQRLDRKNVDEALVQFLELNAEWTREFVPYFTQLQREVNIAIAQLKMAGKVGDAVAETLFEQILAGAVVEGMENSMVQNLEKKWFPVLEKLAADCQKKYEPRRGNLLKYLSKKYEYPFYSLEYGGE